MADLVSSTGAVVAGSLALLSLKWYFSKPDVRYNVLSLRAAGSASLA